MIVSTVRFYLQSNNLLAFEIKIWQYELKWIQYLHGMENVNLGDGGSFIQ